MVPTQIIPTDAEDVLARVVTVLRNGGLAALPTETVYGLCARADRDEAVRAIFAAKGRPAHNPLIVHGANVEMLSEIGVFGAVANALAERFWPGPLTLVLERKELAPVSALACAGGPTVAVRIPEGSLLREASAAIGPLVAPSANRSGRVSATSADAVMAELSGRIELVADGGPSPIGLESTVVDVTGSPTLLRPGAIPAEALEAIVGPLASGPVAGSPSTSPPPLPLRSPGLLTSHYAPKARLRLDVPAADVLPDEAWLAFGPEPSAAPPFRTVRLSPERDLSEAARNLYAGLRALDRTGASVIAVSPIPRDGVGAAIADRLARAAAPREDPPQDD